MLWASPLNNEVDRQANLLSDVDGVPRRRVSAGR
jgi:hypothetical protein